MPKKILGDLAAVAWSNKDFPATDFLDYAANALALL